MIDFIGVSWYTFIYRECRERYMNLNEFDSLAKERQSCRKFSNAKVDKKDLKDILDTALLAPSACNSQPWKVYCVESAEKVKAVAESLQDDGKNSFVSNASAFFVVAENNAKLSPDANSKFASDRFVKYDIGEIVAYLTLAIKAKGLDSCIIGWINEEKLKKAVGLKEDEFCAITIAVGKGEQPLRKKTRKNFEEVVEII